MGEKTTITCLCHIEVEGNEYEALTIVDDMLEKKNAVIDINTDLISKKIILIVKETITTSSEGCGVRYEKENEKV